MPRSPSRRRRSCQAADAAIGDLTTFGHSLASLFERVVDAGIHARRSAAILDAPDTTARPAARLMAAKDAYDAITADVHRAQIDLAEIERLARRRFDEECDAARGEAEILEPAQ